MDLKRLVRKGVSGLTAYEAKDIPCRIKLDANESPYGFAKAAKAATAVATNRYPDPGAVRLKRLLGREFGVRPGQILQGNGSDELIYYLIATFGGPVLFPTPTFSMYGIISRALDERPLAVGLDRDFDLDTPKMLAAIRRHRPKLVFLSSPNNPTGNCFSGDRILKILDACRGLVVVDEAYQPFSSTRGFLPMLRDYDNLVIMRTLSKVGLAALRLGFLVADEAIIGEVNKVRLPFNVNSFSQAAAETALADKKGFTRAVKAIVAERGRMARALAQMPGVTAFPSEANFILFRVDDPLKVHRRLLAEGILIRNMAAAVPGCLRVTVGLPAENTEFLKTLGRILGRRS